MEIKKDVKMDFLNDLKGDVEKFAHKFSSGLAHKISDAMAEEYQYVIDKFYSEYDPEYYVRHSERGMKPGLNKTYKKYYTNKHNSIYYGGIEISPDRMYDDYRDSKEKVLSSFLDGYHGRPSAGIESSLLPYKHMLRFRNQLINALLSMDGNAVDSNGRAENLISEARAEAAGLKYKIVKFV